MHSEHKCSISFVSMQYPFSEQIQSYVGSEENSGKKQVRYKVDAGTVFCICKCIAMIARIWTLPRTHVCYGQIIKFGIL